MTWYIKSGPFLVQNIVDISIFIYKHCNCVIKYGMWYEKEFKINEISYILCKTEVGQWVKINAEKYNKYLHK